MQQQGRDIPDVGIKIYDHGTTGRIMALDTAILRRKDLTDTIPMPIPPEKLSSPDLLAQSKFSGLPVFIKIDESFKPEDSEINEILELNKPYKPVLNRLFPEGINVYMIPGYQDEKNGDLEGGRYISGPSGNGIWLNSYNVEDLYLFKVLPEACIAKSRGIKDFRPSVLKGNKDRARVLAHEIGHAISCKLIDEYKVPEEKPTDSLILAPTEAISFLDGWRSLRTQSKLNLNGNEITYIKNKAISDSDKANIHMEVDLETVAEDIRLAITGSTIPSSSKMTGMFDQTEEGKKELNNATKYIRECLLENKPPQEAILGFLKSY